MTNNSVIFGQGVGISEDNQAAILGGYQVGFYRNYATLAIGDYAGVVDNAYCLMSVSGNLGDFYSAPTAVGNYAAVIVGSGASEEAFVGNNRSFIAMAGTNATVDSCNYGTYVGQYLEMNYNEFCTVALRGDYGSPLAEIYNNTYSSIHGWIDYDGRIRNNSFSTIVTDLQDIDLTDNIHCSINLDEGNLSYNYRSIIHGQDIAVGFVQDSFIMGTEHVIDYATRGFFLGEGINSNSKNNEFIFGSFNTVLTGTQKFALSDGTSDGARSNYFVVATGDDETAYHEGTGLVKEIGGVTGSRPASPRNFQQYFDTTLNKPIWFNGSNWVDATGTTV